MVDFGGAEHPASKPNEINSTTHVLFILITSSFSYFPARLIPYHAVKIGSNQFAIQTFAWRKFDRTS